MTDQNNVINQTASEGSNSTKNKPTVDINKLKQQFFKGFFEKQDENQMKELYNLTKDSQDITIPTEIITKLTRYKSLPENNEIFASINISELNKFDIIREIMVHGGVKLESSKKHLEGLFNNLYKIKDPDKMELSKEIEKLNQSEIESLIYSELNRDKLISKFFKNSKPEKKNIVEKFKSIEGLDYNSLNEEQKKALEGFVDNGYETPALIELLKKNFSIEQKKALVKAYLGPINLGKLEELGLINKDKCNEIINFKAREILKNHLTEAEINEKLEEIKDFIIPYNIILSPEEIYSHSSSGEEVITNKLLEQDVFTNLFKEARNQTKKSENASANQTKEDFLNSLSQFSNQIPNIDKIKKGDVLRCIINDGTGQNEDGDSYNKFVYIYIKIEDIRDNSISIKELTHETGGDKVCEDISKVVPTEYSFEQMSNFFGKVDKGVIFNAKEFEEKIKNHDIKSLPSEGTDIKNKLDLEKLIDNEDSKGINFGLKVGTVFEFSEIQEEGDKKSGKGNTVSVASITKIDDTNITIRSQGERTFSLNEFFRSFKKQKSTRIANISSNDDLLKTLQGSDKVKKFGDIEWDKDFKNLIYKPQKDNKKFPKIDHFVNKNGECLKITNIDSSGFDIQVGEFEEKKIEDPKDKKKRIDSKSFTAKIKSRMTPEIFYAYITKNGLEPYIDTKAIIAQETVSTKGMAQKTSIGQSFFKLHNFASLAAGGKQFVEHIKHSLKATSELQAAEFALSLGRVLPDGMQSEFQAKVDGTNKKKMNDKIIELENLGPSVVMGYIEKRLGIKNLPRYELEALLIFVMKKHGSLYPTNLKGYAGSYFWFKKLAGLHQDADITQTKIYREYADSRARDGLSITEEDLIEKLIVQLGIDGHVRSSFVGEFLGTYSEGREKQKDGGLKECKDKYTTVDGKINFALEDRLKKGRYMQALGAIEGILDKGGTAAQMNTVPFIFLASGILRTLDSNGAGGHLKSLGSKHREPMLLFGATAAKMDIFDKVFIGFANDISKDCGDAANDIMKARKGGETHEKIIDKCTDFWDKYGKEIVTKFNTTDPEMMIRAQERGGEYKDYLSHTNFFLAKTSCTKGHEENGLCDKDRINFMSSGYDFLANNLGSVGGSNKALTDVKDVILNSLISGIDDIKKENDEVKQRKIFRYYNREILKWLAKNNTSIMQKGKLEKIVWGSKITERLWIPSSETDCNRIIHGVDGLDGGSFNSEIDNAFKEFTKPRPKEKVKTEKEKVKTKVSDILGMSKKPNLSNKFPDHTKKSKKRNEEDEERNEEDEENIDDDERD